MKHESGIQLACMNLLSFYEAQNKLFWWRNNSFAGYIQRANGSKGYIQNNKPGLPDLCVIYKGQFYGLEVKTPTGKMSPNQKEAEARITAAGGQYRVVRDVSDISAIFGA
jgi:hypothetical protein